MLAASLVLAGCGGGDDDKAEETAPPEPNNSGNGDSDTAPPPAAAGNQAPTIAGDPPTQTMQDTQFTFAPTADDADGDTLTFDVANLPSWALFDPSTGRVSGTPEQGDLGTYENIRISVSDGEATAALAAFTVEVVATAHGSATLSWMPPTERTDGSPLGSHEIAGYKIYWGASEGDYPNWQGIEAGVTDHVVEELTPGTWYFVATTLDVDGLESGYSNAAIKTVQ